MLSIAALRLLVSSSLPLPLPSPAHPPPCTALVDTDTGLAISVSFVAAICAGTGRAADAGLGKSGIVAFATACAIAALQLNCPCASSDHCLSSRAKSSFEETTDVMADMIADQSSAEGISGAAGPPTSPHTAELLEMAPKEDGSIVPEIPRCTPATSAVRGRRITGLRTRSSWSFPTGPPPRTAGRMAAAPFAAASLDAAATAAAAAAAAELLLFADVTARELHLLYCAHPERATGPDVCCAWPVSVPLSWCAAIPPSPRDPPSSE